MTEAEQIAAGLSEIEREAILLGIGSRQIMLHLNSIELVHVLDRKTSEGELVSSRYTLTPLGLAVRAILER